MPAYRTGNHWGTTVIENGTQPPAADGTHADDRLVAVVLRDDAWLAERIAGLLSERCDCGHEGLHAMFHLTPCPVAFLRQQARKLGYDLALIPREDT